MHTYGWSPIAELFFHHLDLSVKPVKLLARVSSACDDGMVSADVYISVNVGWPTISVFLSLWDL